MTCNELIEGKHIGASGWLTLQPNDNDDPNGIIDDIATLLTSGRMSVENRNILKNAYLSEQDPDKAFRLAQQLGVSSPEFHTTGMMKSSGKSREESLPVLKPCKKHKAVVHILLAGGCDSYNMLDHILNAASMKVSTNVCLVLEMSLCF